MKKNRPNHKEAASGKEFAPGFTLIELMVGMVVSSVALAAIYTVYFTTIDSYRIQREMADMQQNLRAAMSLIKNDLRNSGRGGVLSGRVGIVDDKYVDDIQWNPVGRFNPDSDDSIGYPGITMARYIDRDGDGAAETTAPREIISYRVFDAEGDGRRELRRQVFFEGDAGPFPWVLVFDGIEDIGFAFAFDSDNDRALDRTILAGGDAGPVIWAIDSDDDHGLDTNSDNLPDGDVDEGDDGDGDGRIDAVDGDMGTEISLEDIRAVRIWLLARSRESYPDYIDNGIYVLGHKVIDMSDAEANAGRRNFRHKMLQGAVSMQNTKIEP